MTNKICQECNIEKDINDFHKDGNKHRSVCKNCRNNYKKKLVKKRKERFIYNPNTKKICSFCNKEKLASQFPINKSEATGINSICKECSNLKTHNFQTSLNGKYFIYKKSAEVKKLNFQFSKEEFFNIINQVCNYCGNIDGYNGIDRTNNTLGYTPNNCVPCCYTCNNIKSNIDYKYFLIKLKSIYNKVNNVVDIQLLTLNCAKCQIDKQIQNISLARVNNLITFICIDCRNKRSNKNGYINNLYKIYKKHAEERNLLFELNIDLYNKLIQQNCYYCGVRNYPNGIDRINNNLGYIIENSVSCCTACNVMKGKMTYEDFITHIIKIIDYQKTLK